MQATHANVAHPDRLALFPSEPQRLEAVRVIARVGGPRVPLFCLADDHAHFLVLAPPVRARLLVRSLVQALNYRLGFKLAPPFFKPVQSRTHFEGLFRYILDQTSHHDIQLAAHPALWPGSSFHDLVGARRLSGFDRRLLAEALPRWSDEPIFAAVGLRPCRPVGDGALQAVGLEGLVEAAARAVGRPDLLGRRTPVIRARRTLARTARELGFADRQIARALGCPRRTASHLAATARSDPDMSRALRLQVALHRAVQARALPVRSNPGR